MNTLEKVRSILVSACLCMRASMCACVHSCFRLASVCSKNFKARVLKFHIWIPRQKIAYTYFFLSKLSPLAELFLSLHNAIRPRGHSRQVALSSNPSMLIDKSKNKSMIVSENMIVEGMKDDRLK